MSGSLSTVHCNTAQWDYTQKLKEEQEWGRNQGSGKQGKSSKKIMFFPTTRYKF